MRQRRVRHACAAALAITAVMTLAATATAHPVDCDDPAAKFEGMPADWAAENPAGSRRRAADRRPRPR